MKSFESETSPQSSLVENTNPFFDEQWNVSNRTLRIAKRERALTENLGRLEYLPKRLAKALIDIRTEATGIVDGQDLAPVCNRMMLLVLSAGDLIKREDVQWLFEIADKKKGIKKEGATFEYCSESDTSINPHELLGALTRRELRLSNVDGVDLLNIDNRMDWLMKNTNHCLFPSDSSGHENNVSKVNQSGLRLATNELFIEGGDLHADRYKNTKAIIKPFVLPLSIYESDINSDMIDGRVTHSQARMLEWFHAASKLVRLELDMLRVQLELDLKNGQNSESKERKMDDFRRTISSALNGIAQAIRDADWSHEGYSVRKMSTREENRELLQHIETVLHHLSLGAELYGDELMMKALQIVSDEYKAIDKSSDDILCDNREDYFNHIKFESFVVQVAVIAEIAGSPAHAAQESHDREVTVG